MKLKLTVDGKLYEVDVEVSESQQPHPSYVPPAGQTNAPMDARSSAPPTASQNQPARDDIKVCCSPISGIVVRVSAQVGQAIQANDALMVLEAMKMETVIMSPVDGKIAKINAAVGDPVQAEQVLVEFE